jgi:hypothetical protein
MNRLNTFYKEDTLSLRFFIPNKDFYKNIHSENFAQLLTSNATTDKGQETIARCYNVYNEWVASEHHDDEIKKYYKLLFLVKTKGTTITCGSVSLKDYIFMLPPLHVCCA